MSENSLPRKVWVLTPGFAPKEIELVRIGFYPGYFETSSGKSYFSTDIYHSKREAIEAGWRKLDDQWSTLQKRADAIVKNKAMLSKHSADI
ncbi:hypothetical protein SAMN03159390_00583 [Pseudomonas sp. NFACC49-2]|uniref:hypothetical protein n=1 Tax=Pseudomonas sp. NFACC49-2 TaxID=1566222 RepID=UPI0009204CA1|nr:hypothetical protein [Pseudomonas sp. NFACC49-2]SFX16432.1 hypothetical protein SAMN03159390_00583 [Pseudomonas sp. NFACC49-2]